MAKATPDTICLKGAPIYKELPLETLDVYGVGAITPGMLIQRTSTGAVQPHSSAAGVVAPILFAVEGLNIDPDSKTLGGIDDDYDTDAQAVKYGAFQPGDEVYALLAAGNDTNGANALLASNGDGTLRVSATNPCARALEDVDNDPGTASAAVRIRVEVL